MPRVGAIILAAGLSARMGSPKFLLPIRNKPMILHPVELAHQHNLYPIIIVAGEHQDEIREVTKAFPSIIHVMNERYQTGMASSIKKGIEAIQGKADAAMIFLADQPFIPPSVMIRMMETYTEGILIIRPSFARQDGHPVLFDASLFPLFSELQGDEGGRRIIKMQPADKVIRLSFPDSEGGTDIDTPDDYRKYKDR